MPLGSFLPWQSCTVCAELQRASLTCPHRYDRQAPGDADPHLEELVGLVVWLTTCGRSELKVFDSVTYPQLEGFKFNHEESGGCYYVSERAGGYGGYRAIL